MCSFFLEETSFVFFIFMTFNLSCPSLVVQFEFTHPWKSHLYVESEGQLCEDLSSLSLSHRISMEQMLQRFVSLVPCCGVHSNLVIKRSLEQEVSIENILRGEVVRPHVPQPLLSFSKYSSSLWSHQLEISWRLPFRNGKKGHSNIECFSAPCFKRHWCIRSEPLQSWVFCEGND